MSVIGLFGGTFDPFHKAHRVLADQAMRELDLDSLVVMPVGRPPHKSRLISLAAFRFEMTCLGLREVTGARVSDDEIKEGQLSYTYDTVLRLKKDNPGEEITLITGSDTLFAIDSWYRPHDLLGQVRLAVALRGEEDAIKAEKRARQVESRYEGRVTLFPMPRLEVSSSLIREKLYLGQAIDDLCPTEVESFIGRYQIYSFQAEIEALGEEKWMDLLDTERFIWPHLSQGRRLHAASVALYAARLARLNGADMADAAKAGLLHDMAKELPWEEQRVLADRYYFDQEGRREDRMDFSSSSQLCHGPASAVWARDDQGIGDEVMEAIAYHSTAAPGMSLLGEILFLADKIAYDREFERLDEIRQLAETGNIRKAMILCLEEVFLSLEKRGEEVHPLSQRAYQDYQKIP